MIYWQKVNCLNLSTISKLDKQLHFEEINSSIICLFQFFSEHGSGTKDDARLPKTQHHIHFDR
ncbi:Hypothetical protein I595_3284 [Croceitalea dokdonensis DOKDO 023]|uniref:Uncharacterized protein n=1 Tax=Croceitalea dokdonensis DOKDO 023 TaxID=1300341 RepID=A0A0P7AZ29_9FLAO|nr:Hypothetical protein I595_3284 [Croceitalea dokdonensis DOKDO 023]